MIVKACNHCKKLNTETTLFDFSLTRKNLLREQMPDPNAEVIGFCVVSEPALAPIDRYIPNETLCGNCLKQQCVLALIKLTGAEMTIA
jgi:hypothetical protein